MVKTVKADDLVANLMMTFEALNEYQWKLNPNKCIFDASSGILLGNVVSQRGIEANPEKIQAVINKKPPKNVKDIQKLTACMAALSRFIARLGEK